MSIEAIDVQFFFKKVLLIVGKNPKTIIKHGFAFHRPEAVLTVIALIPNASLKLLVLCLSYYCKILTS